MVDVWSIHISQLTYRSHLPHGRWSEHQKTDKAQTTTTEVQLELIFLLLLLQPSGKLSKILISTWRIRI